MSNDFIRAAGVNDIMPGKMKRLDINGRRILLANVGGGFYAADDTCTHEEASLSTGFLKGELVQCPLHGSRFNVRTGEALEEPAQENLKTYVLKIEGNDILIDLA